MPCADQVAEAGQGGVDVAVEPAQRGLPFGHRALQQPAQLDHGRVLDGRGRQHRHAAEAVLVEQPAQVAEDLRQVGGGQPVGLVQDDHGDVLVAVELAQVGLVHHPVRVLLRVDDPDDQVDQAEQPVDLDPVGRLDGVEVGQVEQHQPAQRRLVVAVECALPDEPVARQHADPVEQPVGALQVAPHAGVRHAGRRPADADRREVEAGQRVEEA
jgi:hypothetical protein